MKNLCCVLVALAALTAPAAAQDFPSKPIKLVVPFSPGAGTDASARVIAEALGARIGQPVIVDNRPGAAGAIGVDYVAKAPADGYTLVSTSSDPVTILPAVKANMPFKVPEDLSYIAKFAQTSFALAISANVPAKTLDEFIAHAKANPGKIRYGTTGPGSGNHLTTLLFEKQTGVKLTHIPYKGGAQVIADLVGGQIDMAFITPLSIVPFAQSDRIRIFAVTTPQRHPLLASVPTMTELGLPGVAFTAWYGIMGPAKMPAAIQEKLRKELAVALQDPAVKDKIEKVGLQLVPAFGGDFEKIVVDEIAQWKALADAEKLTMD